MTVTEAMKARRFGEMALPHLNAAYNLARWLTRSDQDAQDIVQEAYLRAFKFFDGFHGEDARAWLLAIVRNTTYTWLQQNRNHVHNAFFDEDFYDLNEADSATLCDQPDNNPAAILARNDDKRLLDRALGQLPVEFREVLVLRELEDLSYKEISRIAGIPIGTVMSRLARGRRLLQACLARMN
jgi:RNA polymerase sigma factor (sigma-70 family)